MYGFVIRALENLITRGYGKEKWKAIMEKACLKMDEEEFLERYMYDDQNTFDLINSAASVIGIPVKQILERFGESFFELMLESGFEASLRSLGSDLPSFLSGLDSLHDHMAYRYPGMRAPSFRVTDVAKDGSLMLHYYSERNGLEHMVVGATKRLAKYLFNIDIKMKITKRQGQTSDHTEFFIQPVGRVDDNKNELEPGPNQHYVFGCEADTNLDAVIDTATFCQAFPFHVVFDRDMTICQAGSSLMRVVQGLRPGLTKFKDVMSFIRPHIEMAFEDILSRINSVFVVRTIETYCDRSPLLEESNDEEDVFSDDSSVSDSSDSALRLKGQMMYLCESDTILFMASPRILSLDGLNEKGMYLSDIPIHDATRDLILISEQHTAEHELSKKLEVVTERLQQTSRELEYEQKLADRLLYSILPSAVANELRCRRPVAAKKYEPVTIMFSGIVDFSNMCNNSSEPMEIVEMLNKIYTKFDQVTEQNPEVYKVETVGDKYMAVSGLPSVCESHAHNIAQLAIDMHEIASAIVINERRVKVTIGIHSGEVVAGVVGQKLPRYCLFGNTVNLTSRCETTGLQGRINVTEYAHAYIMKSPDATWEFEERGPVQMKGRKAPMMCYLLSKKR